MSRVVMDILAAVVRANGIGIISDKHFGRLSDKDREALTMADDEYAAWVRRMTDEIGEALEKSR